MYPDAVPLNHGSQKFVFKATHSQHGVIVVKIGNYASFNDLERIRREVITLREISSPYYPKNFDFQVVDAQRFVICEEFIDARRLSDCILEFQQPEQALPFFKTLVQGLEVLWSKNIVHRDLKPDNILITSSGEPRIIDLGVARLLDMKSLTQAFGFVGTPNYASPEMLLARKAGIDRRADQFSLGIILLQALMLNQHPFDPSLVGGNSIPENIMIGKWHKSILESNELLPLKGFVTKILSTEPHQRYKDISRLIQHIDQAMEAIK